MVQELTRYIKKNYVSGDIAKQMCDTVKWKLANGKYDPALNPDEFTFEITKDLRRIGNDQHISVTRPIYKLFDEVSYDSKLDRMTDKRRRKYLDKRRKGWRKFEAEYKKRTKEDMFTYGEIKILPGNIGYVEIKDFESTSYDSKKNKGRITIEAVMNFFNNANAIIIDLRDNPGGYIIQAAKFCSFFSSATSNYFITTEWHFRYDSSGIEKEISGVNKMLTSDKIDNSRTKSKAIYLLTSRRTFSAAELSAYKIKQYNPSTIIIGEKTRGGGNGHSGGTTGRYFSAVIPHFKTFDENNSNYTLEAKGIIPDTLTFSDSAFTVAYSLALKGKEPTDTKIKHFMQPKAAVATNEQYFRKYYQGYIGGYRKIQIISEGDKLFMIYDTYIKTRLLPGDKDYFTGSNIHFVRFSRDVNGHVTEIQIKHSDEFSERFTRQ